MQDELRQFIEAAYYEDLSTSGDVTSLACIPEDAISTARLLVKDAGVIAGVDIGRQIFHYTDPEIEFEQLIEDGKAVSYGDIAFRVTGKSQAILRAERLVLNTMQRMSGIASLTNRFLFEVEDLPVKILDTRKTSPRLRFLEKEAVRLGGGTNYRYGLFDRFMIKDNHIDACGGIRQAIERVNAYRAAHAPGHKITVEVRNLVELHEVLEVGQVDRIMLDNFEVPLLHEAVATIQGRFETEASGGVNIHTVRKIALSGVDYISVGALTHSAGSLDLSLKMVK